MVSLRRFRLQALLLIELRPAVMIFEMDKEGLPTFRIKGCQPLVFGDGFVNLPVLLVSPGQRIFQERKVVSNQHRTIAKRNQNPERRFFKKRNGLLKFSLMDILFLHRSAKSTKIVWER